jgi:hypothetical protein
MNESSRRHFDLARFVMEFLEQRESIVTPPAYGVVEALLPDELAAELELDPYQRLAFASTSDEEALRLSYNHPVVEEMAERLQKQPANALVYINHVRLSKQGLLDLARERYLFPNARLSPRAKATQGRALHHYLRFNFKVALISDEKQEFILSTVMDVQGGYAVRDADQLARLELYETQPAFDGLPVAPILWQEDDESLSGETVQALLQRAKVAVVDEMADRLAALQIRADRHLQLDRARIEGYYDDLEADMQRRRDRIADADKERRTDAEEKLAVLHAERQTKLEHLAARYQVRVEVELINLLLLVQPKIRLPVTISNRTTDITRMAVWDPLMHRLEPLVCDVCGLPGQDLHLCVGKHLAHGHCLADQCIDCSRAYCQRCSDEIGECAVCHQPVCQRSLIICSTCGRGTCREHQTLCHAADGAPVDLSTVAAEPEQPPTPKPPAPEKTQADKPGRRGKPTKQKQMPDPANKQRLVKAVRIEVNLFEERPQIVAHVMRSTNRSWAVRSILLTREGISVRCECEKGDTCEVNGYIHRPANARDIAEQLEKMLKLLRSEYLTPAKKMNYTYVSHDHILRESQTLELPEVWLDEEKLRAAQRGFDKLR